jgi:hypothetical protein
MSNDIYSYIKENFGIEITDYQFKRDYIKEPLKITKNGVGNELPFKEDLEYLYLILNLPVSLISLIFNLTSSPIRKYIKKFNLYKSKELFLKCKNNSMIRKYGVDNVFKLPIYQNKIKETKLKKYGNSSYHNIDKMKETKLKKYGSSSYHNIDKMKETIFKKYGVNNISQVNDIKKKKEKTFLEHYGVINNFQREEIKIKCNNEIGKEKRNLTMQLNKTFCSSKREDEIYNLLIQKYPNTVRQYRSDLYPFNCDFYIPEIDTYIEYNGFWHHGRKPYIETNEQKEIVKLWEKRSKEINDKGELKKSYDIAIHVWTISDPLKRKTAKDNGLNWIEFFTIEEFMNWYNLLT